MINILTTHGGFYKKGLNTRSMDMTLTPYMEKGDTLLYIAQYADRWEIYAASPASHKVLFSSPNGIFDLNNPDLPEALKCLVEANAAEIKGLRDSGTNYVDESWGYLAVTDDDKAAGNITELADDGERVAVRGGKYPPGHWELQSVEKISEEFINLPKLMKTQWGQNSPWNTYTSNVLDKNGNKVRAKNGCVPLAIAQYLYYTHFKEGLPADVANHATSIDGGDDFIFLENKGNTKWLTMPLSGLYNTSPVAIMIGKIGRDLNAVYGYKSTGVDIKLIDDYLFNIYNTHFPLESFNFDYIRSSIDNGLPVILHAGTDMDSNGNSLSENKAHTFLVDYYEETHCKYKYTYYLVRDPLPEDAYDEWIADLKDKDGNIIAYAYMDEVIKESVENRGISMKWGSVYPEYDVVVYNPNSNWIWDDYTFNLQHLMNKRVNIN